MKKALWIWISILLLPAWVFGQTIQSVTQAEYFIDTDPGVGLGTPLSAVDGSLDEVFEEVTANYGASAGLGLHTLFIRFRNSDGTWGSVYTKPFTITAAGSQTVPVPASLTQAEAFVDTDPGQGGGLALAAADGTMDEFFEEAAATYTGSGGLSLGLHALFVRFRNSDGTWGNAFTRPIVVTTTEAGLVNVPAKIAAGEAFVDTDPGTGNGLALAAVDGNLDEVFEEVTGSMSTGALSLGLHTLFIRVRDSDGPWGDVFARPIVVQPPGVDVVQAPAQLTQAEFFVDTDPGVGNGSAMAAADGGLDEVFEDVSASLSTGSLGLGMHTLYVRFRNSDGSWGNTYQRAINVTPTGTDFVSIPARMTQAEYFIDTDPGPGAGTIFSADDGAFDESYENVNDTISTFGLSEGYHRVGIRYRNDDNTWGPVFYSVFEIQNQFPPSPPQNLTALAGDGAVTLRWSANAENDFLLYRIYGGTAPNPTSLLDSAVGGPADTTRLVSGLSNGVTYYFRITAVDMGGMESGFSNEVSAVPLNTIPPAPPQNLAGFSGNGQVTLRWNPNTEPDFLLYRIYGGTTPNPVIVLDSAVGAADTQRVLSGLTNGVPYYFRLTAVDSAYNESGFSNEVSVTPGDVTPPAPPQNLTAVAGDGQAVLRWSPNTEPDLLVYRIFGGTTPLPSVQIDSIAGDTTRTIAGLINGTTYFFRITAVDNAYNQSGFSNEVSATPANIDPPAPPQNLVAMAGDGQVTLQWSPNMEPDFLRYRLYGGTAPAPTTQIDSALARLDTVRAITGLTNGTTYFFRLTAVDSALNQSAFSNEVTSTPGDTSAPAAPVNLAAVAGDGQITVTWTPNSEPDLLRYRIFMGTGPGPNTQVDSASGANDTSRTYTGLTNGTTYYVRIRAVDNALNQSGYSNEANATPIDLTPPSAPQSLTAAAGDGQITLSWQPNTESDFSRYRIFGGTAPAPVVQIDSVTAVSDTTRVVSGLTNGTTYFFRLTAVDVAGNQSTYSNEVSETPVGINVDPNPFSIKPFGNNELISAPSPTFRWESRGDPDGQTLTYTLDVASDPVFSSIVASESTPDTVYTLSSVLTDGLYYWRVTASDGAGGTAVSNTGFFRLDSGDPTFAFNMLRSPEASRYVRVYVVNDENVPLASGWFVIRDGAGNNRDSSGIALSDLGGGRQVQYGDVKLRFTGTLHITINVQDSAGNNTIVTRTFAVLDLEKEEGWTHEVGPWRVVGVVGTVEEDGLVVIGTTEEALAKSAVESLTLGPPLEILTTVDLSKPLLIEAAYEGSDLDRFQSIDPGYDERKVGLYEKDDDGNLIYLGGEGRSGRVRARLERSSSVVVKYDPEHRFLPKQIDLGQNYPNPFNPSTTIPYALPDDANVKITVYNVLGQQVREVFVGRQRAGYHQARWDGLSDSGHSVASGVYIVRLNANHHSKARKVILVR
jgi:chitodextrinase